MVLADFGRLMGSDAGEKNGPERGEYAERWVGWQTSEVRRRLQESAQTRGNQRNSPEKTPTENGWGWCTGGAMPVLIKPSSIIRLRMFLNTRAMGLSQFDEA